MCFAFCFSISGETHIWSFWAHLLNLLIPDWSSITKCSNRLPPPTGKGLNALDAFVSQKHAVPLDYLDIYHRRLGWMILTYIPMSQQLRTSWKVGNSIWRYLLIWEYLEAHLSKMLCGDRIHFTSFEINNWWRLLATCFCLSPSLVILRFQYVRIVQISCLDSRQSEQVEHFYGSSGTPTLTSHRACLISKFVIECPRVILIQGEPPSYVCCFLNPLTIYI